MNSRRHVLIAVAVALLPVVQACTSETGEETVVADLVVFNADVYTVDPQMRNATAFAVRDGRFLAVGNDADILSFARESTQQIDARGATVTPGFVDGHTHLMLGARLRRGIDVVDEPDREVWRQAIKDKIEELGPGKWITGGQWDHSIGPDQTLPTKALIDDISPNNPVALVDTDWHTMLLNSVALDLVGITADTPDPIGGKIVRDNKGEPTGILFENAKDLVNSHPGYQEAIDSRPQIPEAVRYANSLGITTVQDMGQDYDIYLRLLDEDNLTLRVWYGWAFQTPEEAGDGSILEQLALDRDKLHDRLAATGIVEKSGPTLELGYVKYWLDGVMSVYSALFKEPYSDNPDAVPQPTLPHDQLFMLIEKAHANGFPVAVHALGDLAVQWALDGVERSTKRATGALPDRVEHMEIVAPEEFPRFRQLNVAASMQPHHMACCTGNYVIRRAGPERMKGAFAWRRVLDNGGRLVLGSDWPTGASRHFSPVLQMGDAIFREDTIPWNDVVKFDEGMELTFEEALTAYTQSSANMTAWGDQIGSITRGKWADFVIFDAKIAVPAERTLLERKVMATYLAGKRIYSATDP